jgi:ABC-type enterochelin transport system substrate-binding protein
LAQIRIFQGSGEEKDAGSSCFCRKLPSNDTNQTKEISSNAHKLFYKHIKAQKLISKNPEIAVISDSATILRKIFH